MQSKTRAGVVRVLWIVHTFKKGSLWKKKVAALEQSEIMLKSLYLNPFYRELYGCSLLQKLKACFV